MRNLPRPPILESLTVEDNSGRDQVRILSAVNECSIPLSGICFAALSGILWFVASPGFNIWPLAWIAMIPCLVAIERASSSRMAALIAWWAGLIMNAGGFYWIIGLLQRFGHLPWAIAVLLFLLFCAYQALRFLLFGWVVCAIRRHTSLPMALIAPITMVTSELSIPAIFPYYLAITQAQQIHIIQIADLTGPLGVTALLLMVNGIVYDIIVGSCYRLSSAIACIIILIAAICYGHIRINQMAERRAAAPKINVGIVQPNLAYNQKGIGQSDMVNTYLSGLQRRSQELEAEGADLIVWPETIYPRFISRQRTGDWREAHPLRIQRGFTVPLIFGAMTYDPTTIGRHPFNSALILDRKGLFTARYDKIFLLLFGEYTPGLELLPWVQKFLPDTAGQYSHGQSVVEFPFQTKDGRMWRLAPMICLEDLLPGFGRAIAGTHPDLMINITDDSWYGDTSEPWEHLALSVYRSVELRTELVRAVNTGVSAYVDATGKIYAQTYSNDPLKKPRAADKILVEVALIEGGHTIYAAIGDVFGYLNIAATFYILMRILQRSYRRKGTYPS